MGIFEGLGKIILEGISDGLNRAKENSLNRIRYEIFRVEKRVVNNLIYLALSLIAFLFIALGVILLLKEYLNLSMGLSFLIIGIISLIIGLFFKTV